VLEHDVEIRAGFGRFRDDCDAGIHNLCEIVRRDVSRHSDSDTTATVDDEVRDARWENSGLEGGLVVVGSEVDGVGVDVCEHLAGYAGEARFCIPHGGRWVAVYGPKVALAVNEGIAHGEWLREPDHGVVNGGVAVGVEAAQYMADDPRPWYFSC
jgi:hypothetical protein